MDTPDGGLPDDILSFLPAFFTGPDPVALWLDDGHNTLLYNDKFGARFDIRACADVFSERIGTIGPGREAVLETVMLPNLAGETVDCRVFCAGAVSTGTGMRVVALRIMEKTTDRAKLAELERLRMAYDMLVDEHERELAQAARIHRALVPPSIHLPELSCATRHRSMRGLGGDFGWITDLPDGRVYAVICDVSGHGVGAGLFAHRLHAEALRLCEKVILPAELLAALDQYGFDLTQGSGVFFSFQALLMDPAKKTMLFSGAGHPPMMLRTPEEPGVRRIDSQGTLLGCFGRPMHEPVYSEYEMPPGSRIVLYTDGITETFDAGRNQLGIDGLDALFENTEISSPADEIADIIMAGVNNFREGQVTDDYTLMVIETREAWQSPA